MSLMLPTIHLNGTNGEVLLEQASETKLALLDARAAMLRMGPNGRDFYLQPGAAIIEAQAMHAGMMKRLDAIIAEVEEYQEGVADGGSTRGRWKADGGGP